MTHAIRASQGFTFRRKLDDFDTGSLGLFAGFTILVLEIKNGIIPPFGSFAIHTLKSLFCHNSSILCKVTFLF